MDFLKSNASFQNIGLMFHILCILKEKLYGNDGV